MSRMLIRDDNIKVMKLLEAESMDCIYADCIYQRVDFSWAWFALKLLKPNGIFYLQTDSSTVFKWYPELRSWFGREAINDLIYVNEWGGTSKRFFPKKHDTILMFCRTDDYKFYPERIQIPKVTAGTAFDKKGTGLKTPCDVFYDHPSFSTVSKERVLVEGQCISWQKPLWLMDRLLAPVTDENDRILDPFMGSGTAGVWCKHNNRSYIGIEEDESTYKVAKERIENG